MARFRFRLQTLLKVRESERRQRRQELAAAYQADEIVQERINRLRMEQTNIRKRSIVAASPGDVNVNQLIDTHRYGILLRVRMQKLIGQQEQIREEVERRRQALVESDREVRVLEKLKDKQNATHRSEEERRDMKQMDEIAQRHVRRPQ